MANFKPYEGQEFHDPSDPSKPVLVYRQGKYFQKGQLPAMAVNNNDQKAIQAARDLASQRLNVAQQAEQFMKYNKDVSTGPILGIPGAQGLRALGPGGDKVQAMQAIAARVAPQMRPIGSGATSDKDMAIYMQSFPGLQKHGNANRNITQDLTQDAAKAAAWASFAEKWGSVRGNLNGAQGAFDQFWANRSKSAPSATRSAAPASSGWGIQEVK